MGQLFKADFNSDNVDEPVYEAPFSFLGLAILDEMDRMIKNDQVDPHKL